MSWKLKTVILDNFKYFHAPFTLDVISKNLLVYGENGSGKSSIYWALYTLFQSRLKPDDASVKKYFDPTHEENLRNKYSLDTDPSSIKVVFHDKDTPGSLDKTYEISLATVNTQNNADSFLSFTIASSDFLNYKMLSKLTDKENSKKNDITDLFVKEIYPFADFRITYIKLDGTRSTQRNAEAWHRYIYDSVNQLKKQTGSRKNQFDTKDPGYEHFETLLSEFRDELAYYLQEISQRANYKLEHDFNIKDVEIVLSIDPVFLFNLPQRTRYRDHKLHPLGIYLNTKLKNTQLAGGEAQVTRLRTFYNEAKLTCIGLAIRLAVVDAKFAGGPNLASLLCVDDLLVSLDMSYRVPVTKALLSYANRYQMCIFTHDRSMYHMIKSTIKELGYNIDDWKCLEFYRSDPSKETVEEPQPHWYEDNGYEDKVKIYMNRGDYPAAGNYLRKYAEDLIKSILPQNMCYEWKPNGEIKALMLRKLYDETKSGKNEGFCKLYDINPSAMPDISKHLTRLMNPLSHDDKEVPLYRQELEAAFTEVLKYKPIAVAKHVIVDRQHATKTVFKIEMVNGGVNMRATFVTTEQWDCIDTPIFGGKKYKNCEVLIKSSTDPSIRIGTKMRIKNLYDIMKGIVFPAPAVAPLFDLAIVDNSTGNSLATL